MPVLTLGKPTAPASAPLVLGKVLNAVRQPLRMPAWSVAAIVLVVGASAFTTGRHKPAHHYVSYFGYPLVLDTTTGKACYAAPPQPADAVAQDASFAINGAQDASASGPTIPMCSKE